MDISPGAYAIVGMVAHNSVSFVQLQICINYLIGAAALTSGVTRAVSSAVLAVELTGQIGLLLPVFVRRINNTCILNCFKPSMYAGIRIDFNWSWSSYYTSRI